MLNTNDPVSMHLLMETAMGDSQQFAVLSFDELDENKRELAVLTSRVEATKRKLILETKLRDAAQSLHRLYMNKGRDVSGEGSSNSPNSPKRHRRSFIGSRSSGASDLLSKTDNEMAASTRQCEELAQELWKLEQRAQKLQKALLEHTAGILQMTHKGYLSNVAPLGTPEAIHVHSGGSSRMTDGADDFDERSWYRSHDTVDEFGGVDENGRRQMDSRRRSPSPAARAIQSVDFTRQTEAIIATEKKLKDLNARLKDMLAHTRPTQPSTTPPFAGDEQSSENGLEEQISLLETGLEAINKSHNDALSRAEGEIHLTEQKIQGVNRRLQANIARNGEDLDSEYPTPSQTSGGNVQDQIGYLEGGLGVMEEQLQRLIDALDTSSSKSTSHQERAEQLETVVTGLWAMLFTEEADSRHQNEHDRSMDAGEASGGSEDDFSLQKFSTRVQALYSRATALEEQKEILTRQLQQQRDLGSKSISEKDSHLADLNTELEDLKRVLETTAREAKATEVQLALAVERLDAAEQDAILRQEQKGMDEDNALNAEKAARKEAEEHFFTELQAKEVEISELATRLTELRDEGETAKFELQAKLQESEERIRDLSAQLDEAVGAKAAFEATEAQWKQKAEKKTKEAEKVHQEMKELEGEVVRLHTEVTVAKAELDGAYGTRAQRAAEVAANPALQKELDDLSDRNKSLLEEVAALKAQGSSSSSGDPELTERVELLQRELAETIGEYEIMTKSSIEFEKDREQLEATIDSLRDRCESLDTQLSDERVRWLGMKSPGSGGRDSLAPSNTSTMVLKNEFKKMMRETRAENMKALRVHFAYCDLDYYDADMLYRLNKKSAGNSRLLCGL